MGEPAGAAPGVDWRGGARAGAGAESITATAGGRRGGTLSIAARRSSEHDFCVPTLGRKPPRRSSNKRRRPAPRGRPLVRSIPAPRLPLQLGEAAVVPLVQGQVAVVHLQGQQGQAGRPQPPAAAADEPLVLVPAPAGRRPPRPSAAGRSAGRASSGSTTCASPGRRRSGPPGWRSSSSTCRSTPSAGAALEERPPRGRRPGAAGPSPPCSTGSAGPTGVRVWLCPFSRYPYFDPESVLTALQELVGLLVHLVLLELDARPAWPRPGPGSASRRCDVSPSDGAGPVYPQLPFRPWARTMYMTAWVALAFTFGSRVMPAASHRAMVAMAWAYMLFVPRTAAGARPWPSAS